ncbi:MAG TPA: tRNA (adenosine(37)-N6)-threonylcarbamoyltransferase complex dimerization subunit type 1 TsaB [Clostridia bacterium]|nr:tRNA (adenosine(37)-N6)-threonylcarbamoyltransferase complex dimerization subunit type 1 TsaB [Clostridia bacterium]
MKVLAIESSGMVAAVAIASEEKLIGEFLLDHRKTHSQQLMPLIEQLLNNLDMELGDMDLLAVSEGPGSFTGLRIGISTVKGLAQALNKEVIGIPSLDGLAYNLAFRDGLICPIIDARREQVYTSIYRWNSLHKDGDGQGSLERIDDYMAIPLRELIQKLKQYNENMIFNGDGVPVYWNILKEELGDRAYRAPINLLMQRASSIASLALTRSEEIRTKEVKTKGYIELLPFYLRKSQAEQKFATKD